MANTDYGTDVACVDDLDPMFEEITGRRVLIQALLCRFQTPRGGLFYDANYGLDLRSYLGEGFTTADLKLVQTEIAAECLKDERVAAATAVVVMDASQGTMSVTVQIRDATGPFTMVLTVDHVTVTLLENQGL
jgi:hypothetical protein